MKKKNTFNSKDPGFKIPKGYFENIEDVILSHYKFRELKDDSGFIVPNKYFDTIEDRIIENVSEKEKPKVISLIKKQNLIYISSIAAAVVMLFTLFFFDNKPNWNNLNIETVENYIVEEDIGSYEIASLLLEEDIKEEEFVNHNLDEEHIETYLLDYTEVEDLIVEKK